MSLLISGSVAYDTLKTPFGTRKRILGGSASHASVAASIFSNKVSLLAVVGSDFKYTNIFEEKGIDTSGVEVVAGGKTFHWEGYYEGDMGEAFTVKTDLNVFGEFEPKVPVNYQNSRFLFLGNMAPEVQLDIINKVKPKFVAMDTMNFWISTKKKGLLKTIKNVDLLFINNKELQELMGEHNTIKAAKKLLKKGLKYLIVKKGEHGAMLFSADKLVVVPSFPLEVVKDPTGAGDSFAGGVMGYISTKRKINFKILQKALLYGTAMASYMVEDFSSNNLLNINKRDIGTRVSILKSMI